MTSGTPKTDAAVYPDACGTPTINIEDVRKMERGYLARIRDLEKALGVPVKGGVLPAPAGAKT